MVDITKITQEELDSLSPEQLKEAVLKGWEELWKSRWVIANLNKKMKASDNSWDDWEFSFKSKEDLDNYLNERKTRESLDRFLSENEDFADSKDTFNDLVLNKWLSLEQAKAVILSSDETTRNNQNSNLSWISNNGWRSSNSWFVDKIDFKSYNEMNDSEKESYREFADEKFGWLTFKFNAETDL